MQAATSPGLAGNVIPAQHIHFVRLDQKKPVPAAATKAPEPKAAPEYHQPQLTLIKEGDTIRAIEVICTCGEVIRLNCTYSG